MLKECLKIHPANLSHGELHVCPISGLLFQSTFATFVCWLDSCPVSFMPCCLTVEARLLLFMDCENRLGEVE